MTNAGTDGEVEAVEKVTVDITGAETIVIEEEEMELVNVDVEEDEEGIAA